MQRFMLRSKIHGARVTEADLHYVGSITIDRDLLDAADLLPGEKVLVIDLESGARLETYVFEGARGSGVIGVNGGAARHCQVGDRLLIMAFAALEEHELAGHRPRLVFVDENNAVGSAVRS
jgi:aspartate 1-decarboxylase